jgi:hypothetical protein
LIPNSSKPGNDGQPLPEGSDPWPRSLTYTVRPEILRPLVFGQRYRILVSGVRKVAGDSSPTLYANLYARAKTIATARVASLKRPALDQTLSARILAQGWFTFERIPAATAFLTMEVVCLRDSEPAPEGERSPSPEEFSKPRGITPEALKTAASLNSRIDESYKYVDPAAPDSSEPPHNIYLVSYGEYVETCSRVDYRPLIERAENLAKFHRAFLTGDSSSELGLKILRREWFCATNPDIAVVHVYIEL